MAKKNANKLIEVDKANIYIEYNHDKNCHEITYNKNLNFPNASNFYSKEMKNSKTDEISAYGDLFTMKDNEEKIYLYPREKEDIFEKDDLYLIDNWVFLEDEKRNNENASDLKQEVAIIKDALMDLYKLVGDVMGLTKGHLVHNQNVDIALRECIHTMRSIKRTVEELNDKMTPHT